MSETMTREVQGDIEAEEPQRDLGRITLFEAFAEESDRVGIDLSRNSTDNADYDDG